MLRWIPFVMVRIAIFFIAGILVGIYAADFLPQPTCHWIFLMLITAYYFIFFLLGKNEWLSPVSGVIGSLCVVLGGYLMLLQRTESRRPLHLMNVAQPVKYYSGQAGSPAHTSNSTKVEIQIDHVRCAEGWRPATGKVLLYIPSSGDEVVHYGDNVIVKGQPVFVPAPANPGQFDLKEFLANKNIYHLHRIKSGDITTVSLFSGNGFVARSQQARNWAAIRIKRFVSGTREQGITMALVLGIVEGLDGELMSAYSASGAMHVLSVSGLHVGIIYAIILLMLKPLSAWQWSKWLVAILSLMALWAYAFVTGLSPSVLRAVMMFSFMVMARPFGRNTNVYNTLAASAFLLLLYDPYLVLSVGFQLSYLAVLGIVYLQRPIYNLYEMKSLIADKIWQITSVSLAAQLTTFALGFFYFHQFPVYFLISNLVVIPLSTGVLIAGIALLVVSPFVSVAALVAWALQWLIRFLNGSVFIIEELPWSVIDGVQISAVQCLLLMALVLAIVLLFRHRLFRWGYVAAGLSLLFGMFQWIHFGRDVDKDQFIVYNAGRNAAFERIDRGHAFFYADSVFRTDDQQIKFHLLPNRMMAGVGLVNGADTTAIPKSYPGYRFFIWHEYRILWIDQPTANLPTSMETDYLIISHDAVKSQVQWCKIRFKQVILDASNSSGYVRRVTEKVHLEKLEVYSVRDQGAFILTF